VVVVNGTESRTEVSKTKEARFINTYGPTRNFRQIFAIGSQISVELIYIANVAVCV